MCGFAGMYAYEAPLTEETLRAMGNEIAHRGPDHQGVYHVAQSKLGMVHQRLAIVDLDPRSNQPMLSDCGNYVLAYNGEIYNHEAIRTELERAGYVFRSRSDTEVLLNAFREWGPDCLKRFNGMFGLAIWDLAKETMFLARDRLGIKPVYYSDGKAGFAFGSDLKAFQACDAIEKKIDRKSLWQYLFYNYVPQPHSIFENVFKLLPGHWLQWSPRKGLRTQAYWDVPLGNENAGMSEAEWTSKLDELLGSSVERRLMSDVPVGAFLSGGLDSSAIVSHISRSDIKTFTIGFTHQSNTLDLSRSREMAEFRGVQNIQTILDESALDDYSGFSEILDEPFAESSVMALLCNFRIARDEGIKVILSGDGADEILGGYGYLFRLLAMERYQRVPTPIWSILLASSRAVLKGFSPTSKPGKVRDIYIEKTLQALRRDGLAERHELLISGDNVHDLLALGADSSRLGSDLHDGLLQDVHARGRTEASSALGELLYAETKVPLVNKHLAKLDKASMANSVEGRVPFLDHEVVEFAFQLPDSMRRKKSVLKRSLMGNVPRSILEDPKRGFNVPMHDWLNKYIIRGDWSNLWTDRFDDVGIASKVGIQRLVNQNASGRKSNFYTLWSLHVLKQWLENNRFST